MNNQQYFIDYPELFIFVNENTVNYQIQVINDTLNNIDNYASEYDKLWNEIKVYEDSIINRANAFNKQLFESEQAKNFPLIENKVIKFINHFSYLEKQKELERYHFNVYNAKFTNNPKHSLHQIGNKHFKYQNHYGHLTTNPTKLFLQDQIDEYGKRQSDSIEWFVLNKMIKNNQSIWKDWYDYEISKEVILKHLKSKHNNE